MEQKETKIGFFKRLKKAIFELEDYGYFLGERLTVAFKYFFLLLLLVSIVFSVAVTYKCFDALNKAYSYINNELPEFEYKDGALNMEKIVDAYDHDYGFTLLIDTNNNLSENKLKEYKNKVYSQGGYGIIFLNDKLVMLTSDAESEAKYTQYLNAYTSEDIDTTEELNKQELINLLNQVGISGVLISIFIISVISVYFLNIIIVLSDVFVVSLFGWFAARLCGVNFKINPMISLGIYGLSLSIVLDLILDVIYIVTGFTVEYFNIIYLLIAYVYIIAAIFMIKYDLIKHTEELKKIIEVQKQVAKDLQQDELDKQDNNKEDNVDKENKPNDKENEEEDKTVENREPDGSEI